MAKQARFAAPEPSVSIFQDDFQFDLTAASSMISHAPIPPVSNRRKSLQNANPNIASNLSGSQVSGHSPSKRRTWSIDSSSLHPLKPAQGNRMNMVPMMPPARTLKAAPTDSLEKKQPVMSRFKTGVQKPQHSQQQHQQQQHQQQAQLMQQMQAPLQLEIDLNQSHSGVYTEFSIPVESMPNNYPKPSWMLQNVYPRPSNKPALLEPAPIKELRQANKPTSEEPLPPHDSFPPITDDGTKPNHSYATLIGMAILRSPQRRLTLAQIYKWISDTYSFYSPNEAGWQNSIRHNLSLNKHFVKQERPKDDPGKGHYWAIEPGAEHLFMKEKPSRKAAPTAENLPVMSTRLEPSQPQMPRLHEPMLPPHPQMSQSSLPALPPSSQLAPTPAPAPEISSDATIPASDLATFDEGPENVTENHILHDTELYSPGPPLMHSSPPIPKRVGSRHGDTPPSQHVNSDPSASISRSRKRRFTQIDDSGYISSLESSVMRPNTKLLPSEGDRPRIKRGRAEEEIARLRASSYDSPSKGRSYGYPPVSSSPLRQTSHGGRMPPPLTPATKLKAPPKPPPSVSPSTNLRLHRENVQSMVDSPYRRLAALLPDNDMTATPSLNLDEVFFGLDQKMDEQALDFSIFQDNSFNSLVSLSPFRDYTGSPVKRSVKRQKIDRSLSTSALGDMTNISHHIGNSFLKVPGPAAALMLETPSKVFDGLPSSPSKFYMQSPSKILPETNDENALPLDNMDEFCMPEIYAEEYSLDMLAGFEKIGSNRTQTSRNKNKSGLHLRG
ncbi:forkhead protein sep1 [Echria macrotheca]|uniref:Forkhead protein sep1 n=1 Tax=Echria macrotheca TaxID=438768 RepID=A0AAJ0BDY3_9PEZI|nr:forkhead protein sep1 [Echria macrotheca]